MALNYKVSSVWKDAEAHLKVSGVWKLAEVWLKVSGVWKLIGATSFTPVTNTYTSGAANEIVPIGATSVTITVYGAGHGGGRSTTIGAYDAAGGEGGGKSVLTSAVLVSEWGTNLAYSVAAGAPGNTAAGGGSEPPAATTVTGTLNSAAVNISVAYLATGGTTNTDGGLPGFGDFTTTSGDGGANADATASGGTGIGVRGGGGGAGKVNGSNGGTNGGAGGRGEIVFDWT